MNNQLNNRLEGKNIHLIKNNQSILSDVSITLNQGEFITLIGPNGAGKSSLFKVLTGFYHPTNGECYLKGVKLQDWRKKELAKERAVMKQQSQITFSLSAIDIIKLGRSPWAEPINKAMIDEVTEMTECQELVNKDYAFLSGGEQQRIQLARVLVQLWREQGPSGWLFLDEPTSALDLYHQQQMLRLLKKLVQNFPLSVCMVLHDLNLASLWSDQIYLLNKGSIVAKGNVQEVLTEEILKTWYGADLQIIQHQEYQKPYVMLSL
ncbi:ABC-type hemin transport system [Commensalibacter communis]|uniref:ATPase component n=1 Tax=Commensalibacter communis TaxID=2972786 RepID=A0A9W4X965_9PROT|nr:heme ABC transporter ATP-binding protein [Commensalibacter communis]CAI3928208.1 ABC-type hemin transport system [Commensalibacter communis]CAI3928785.1 ABC-type hemin transport system [Commensalibacter communis]CAI3932678.1 ABC-type hemin transport system [Commensalibacter communis]CAI3934216.1 ABC-type hemin transport system [Commensalibacter communis]